MERKQDQTRENKTIEIEAATIEQAIKQALKVLQLKKSEVEIEVLKEEHKGLFGMEGAHPARIKATPKKPITQFRG